MSLLIMNFWHIALLALSALVAVIFGLAALKVASLSDEDFWE